MTSQLKDVDSATHRRINEHGLQIGNTAAECVIEADTFLQMLAEEAGREVMEIANIARKDFLRIPNEFVHPFFERTQHMSKGFLNELLHNIAYTNPVSEMSELVEELESHQDWYRSKIPTFPEDLQVEIDLKTREMNIVKAEIFPILEYALRYFRQATDGIIAGLVNCNE